MRILSFDPHDPDRNTPTLTAQLQRLTHLWRPLAVTSERPFVVQYSHFDGWQISYRPESRASEHFESMLISTLSRETQVALPPSIQPVDALKAICETLEQGFAVRMKVQSSAISLAGYQKTRHYQSERDAFKDLLNRYNLVPASLQSTPHGLQGSSKEGHEFTIEHIPAVPPQTPATTIQL